MALARGADPTQVCDSFCTSPPFGAAEYIGDFRTNKSGNGDNTFKLIVQEAFASTLVAGQRVNLALDRLHLFVRKVRRRLEGLGMQDEQARSAISSTIHKSVVLHWVSAYSK